jgi:hypothetical protein
MIADYIKKSAGNNRNQAKKLVPYIFGATKDKEQINSKHEHTGIKEKIHFIGCSDNICIVDPLQKIVDGKVVKLKGSEADLDEIVNTFNESESKNERAKFPLEHIIIGMHPDDRELSIDEWLEAVQIYVDTMGYENCTWASTLHLDTSSIHAHLVVCNISNKPPHNSVNPSNKFQLSAMARTKIEEKFGLNHTPNPFMDKIQIKNPELSKNQIKNYIRVAIDEVMDANPKITVPQFQLEMQKKDIGVFASLKNYESQIQGFSFSYATSKMTASQLGTGYKTKDLMAEGLNYEMHRDLEQVTDLNAFEKERFELLKGINDEAEKLADDYMNEQEKITNNAMILNQDSYELRQAMRSFSSDHYVVSMMDQSDIEATYQNNETHTFSAIGEVLSNAEAVSSRTLSSIAFDPNDKDGKKARKQMANEDLNIARGKSEKQSRKLIAAWMKIIMMLLSPAKPSCYKHNLPKRGHNMGVLNSRFDKSPVIILSKREIALMTLDGKKFKVIKNVEHKTERFVTLNEKNKIMFINRKNNMAKIARFENELTF